MVHYINNQSGKSYRLQSFGKLSIGEQQLDCAIFKEAYSDKDLVEEKEAFCNSHTQIPILQDKKVKCIAPLNGWPYEKDNWYTIIPGMGIPEELPIIHTTYGQGVHIYMPHILKHFDLLNPVNR